MKKLLSAFVLFFCLTALTFADSASTKKEAAAEKSAKAAVSQKKDAQKNDIAKKDATKKNAEKNSVTDKESTKNESAEKKSVKNNSAKKESVKKSASKKNESKKETVEEKTGKKNAVKKNAEKKDAKKANSAKNEISAKTESAPKNAPVKPVDWMKNDDIIIVHYPANCKVLASMGNLANSIEWKEFSDSFAQNIEKTYKKAISQSKNAGKADKWIRDQIAQEIKKDKVTAKDIMDAYYRHVKLVLSVKNIDLTAGFSKMSSSGSYAAVIDFNPFADQKVRDFCLNDLHAKQLRQTSDCFAFYLPIPQKNIALAAVKVPHTPYYAVIYEENKNNLMSKLDGNWIEKILIPMINQKDKKLNAIHVNLTMFKKIVQCVNEKVPGFKNNLALKNICERLDTIVYSVNMDKNNGLEISLKAAAVNAAGAKEINDLLLGFIALTKLQKSQDTKKASEGQEAAYETLNLLDVTQKGNDVLLTVDLSQKQVEKYGCLLLGSLSKKIQKNVQKNKNILQNSGKNIGKSVEQLKDEIKEKVQKKFQ